MIRRIVAALAAAVITAVVALVAAQPAAAEPTLPGICRNLPAGNSGQWTPGEVNRYRKCRAALAGQHRLTVPAPIPVQPTR